MFVFHVFRETILRLVLCIAFAAFKGKQLACIFSGSFRICWSLRLCRFINHASQPPSSVFIIFRSDTSISRDYGTFRSIIILDSSFSFFSGTFLHCFFLWYLNSLIIFWCFMSYLCLLCFLLTLSPNSIIILSLLTFWSILLISRPILWFE